VCSSDLSLTDCLVIVTRWFGGTKLGTGNLGRAYGECAGLALDEAPMKHVQILTHYRVECSYDDQGIVYAIARRFQAMVEPEAGVERSVFTIQLPPSVGPAFMAALTEECRGRISAMEMPG
jgi:putative IMPACT (imprinted ancient) family translation regulator